MIKSILIPIAVSLAFIADTAAAQTVIKTTGDWSVLKYGSGKSRSCYIASAPQEETGNYKRRGDTFVMVTHRPGEGRDVFELRAGYSYKRALLLRWLSTAKNSIFSPRAVRPGLRMKN